MTFTKIDCTVKYRGKVVLRGRKCTKTGLWMVPLDTSNSVPTVPQTSTESAHHVHTIQQYAANAIPTATRAELAMYYHQCLCSPPKSTLLKAIRNNQLTSFPGLTYELISKHLPPSSATDKGHMVRTRQGTRSTRSNRQAILDARLQVEDMNPPAEQVCTAIDDEMFCFAVLADTNEGTIYSDLTGQFPVQSYSGMNYIFVAYIYTINAIILRPMKNRTDKSMIAVFQDIYEYLKQRGCSPKLHVLDNECSKAVKQYIKSEQVNIQLVEPHNHRVNAAEPAVKTAKYHIIAGLSTVDPKAPLQLWDKWLVQMQDTLNMLRTSRRNASISAFEELEGKFDFNRTPMAPLGTRGLVYLDPDERASWQSHGIDVFSVGRAPDHYRLMEFFDPNTRNYRISGTYKLYPTHCNIPTLSEADQSIIAANELLELLKAKTPPAAELKCKHAKAIQSLTNILENRPEPRVGTSQPPGWVPKLPRLPIQHLRGWFEGHDTSTNTTHATTHPFLQLRKRRRSK